MTKTLFSAPFRPFFLAAAGWAVLSLVVWALWLVHGLRFDMLRAAPFLWHGHTMLSGFAGALIAGFLLTAGANWTGCRTATPGFLLLLVLLWLAGRAADVLPALVLPGALADAGFWLLLAAALLRAVLASRNWRNLGFAVLPLLFGAVDAVWHLDRLGFTPGLARPALWTGIDLLTLIMGAMGGRIIPFFTGRRLLETAPRNPAGLVWAANTALLLALAGNLAMRGTAPAGWLMLTAGLLLLVRLAGWSPPATRREPMLWILHLGYAWLGLGLLLRSGAVLGGLYSEAAALHAVTVGALGALGLGMLTRVALGHTGRLIRADRMLILAFVLVNLAALARLAPLLQFSPRLAYAVSGCLWSLAFLLYLWKFTPILCRPRADA